MNDLAVAEAKLNLLQRSHDYIEGNGFDIQVYSGSDVLNGKPVTPRCFIGVTRGEIGLSPDPAANYGPDDVGIIRRADLGDGPELTEALRQLDVAAEVSVESLTPEQQEGLYPYIEHQCDGEGDGVDLANTMIHEYPGRFVEAVGLYLEDEGIKSEGEGMEKYALCLFRKAITATVEEIDKLQTA